MLSNILKNRRLRMGSFATVLTVIFIAVLIILNMIVSAVSERYPIQLDLTTGKIYGLSDETVEYLKTVEKEVNIYVLATEDSFSSLNDYYLQACETIKKFPQYNSKIQVQFIDLTKDPAFESKYSSYSMGTRDILMECGNKVQVVKTSDLFNLENDSSSGYTYIKSSRTDEAITSAIMNVTSDYTPKITASSPIKTMLVINADKTYTLKSEYIGKKDATFETCGVYHIIGDSIIELITPSSGEKTYYRMLNNKQVMLSNKEGDINKGSLAEHYILNKK